MTNIGLVLGAFITSIALIVLAGLVMSLPVMLLWNYGLIGAVAGVSEIGWLQAWGIMILCGFLFKSTVTKSN